MKFDEFAFFNQQLAAMLRDGIPLEGALRQLTENMQRSELRDQLQLVEADLQNGVPLKQALGKRKFPEFYVHMVNVGVESNDLSGVLLMLADYYRQVDATYTRLKGLMVYPLIVLAGAFALACLLTIVAKHVFSAVYQNPMGHTVPYSIVFNFWVPPVAIGLALAAGIAMAFVPAFQRRLRWRLPAFKEAQLAKVASAMGLMLTTGGNLGDAIGLVKNMERGTVASKELALWDTGLKHGKGKFSDMAKPGRAFPSLFIWLVTNAGEDLAAGFRKAGEVYSERANYRIEMLLYSALPFSIVALGFMIVLEMLPVVRFFMMLFNTSGGIGD